MAMHDGVVSRVLGSYRGTGLMIEVAISANNVSIHSVRVSNLVVGDRVKVESTNGHVFVNNADVSWVVQPCAVGFTVRP